MADKDFKVKNKLFVNGLSQASGVILATNNNLDSHTNVPTQYGGTGTTTSPTSGQILYSPSGSTYTPTDLSSLLSSTPSATNAIEGKVFAYTNSTSGNVGLGYSALGNQSASNDEHVAIGYEALQTIASTAFADIMVGYRSGYGITSGDFNIGIGGFNFWGTTTGNNNIAIGYETLPGWDGFTGNNNIFIGKWAGYEAKPYISNNVAIGSTTLYYADCAYTTAIGAGTLSSATDAPHNTALGYDAAGNLTTGKRNTIIGSEAGTTGATGGDLLDPSPINLLTGSNNVLVGFRAQTLTTNTSNEIVLGNTFNNRFRIPGLGIDWNKNIEIMSYMGAI